MKIKVRVMPNSGREGVEKQGEEYIVRVKAPPQEGKANEAVLKLIASHLKVPRSSVKIVSGLTGRHKIIEIVKF
jgi:uncharacterized protein (TIGR00251 family)